jgi:hypothetical protein
MEQISWSRAFTTESPRRWLHAANFDNYKRCSGMSLKSFQHLLCVTVTHVHNNPLILLRPPFFFFCVFFLAPLIFMLYPGIFQNNPQLLFVFYLVPDLLINIFYLK